MTLAALLREHERAGIERAIAACEKDKDEADKLSGNGKAIAYLTIDCCIENIRALLTKEGT